MLRSKAFWGFLVFLLAAAMVYSAMKIHRPLRTPVAQWRATAPGMEVYDLRGKVAGNDVRIAAVRCDPARVNFRVLFPNADSAAPGSWAEKACPPVGAVINASYFGKRHQPMGLLVIDGKRLQQRFSVHQWSVFQVRDERPELVNGAKIPVAGVTQAFESQPRLIIRGQIPRFKENTPTQRSAVGFDDHGRVILAAVSEGFLTMEQWAMCLKTEFHCTDALNLDGGPSTQLAVRGRVDVTVTGASVPVFLSVTPR